MNAMAAIRRPERDANGDPALVRATRVRGAGPEAGRSQWLGVIVAPEEAAGKLDPQPTADELVRAAECQLAGAGIEGPLQITLFFEL